MILPSQLHFDHLADIVSQIQEVLWREADETEADFYPTTIGHIGVEFLHQLCFEKRRSSWGGIRMWARPLLAG